jgi:hypothetical protein
MDEFHLNFLAPDKLPEVEYAAIYRGLNSRRLHERLRGPFRQVLQ